ncbi:MAG: PLP-dependent aminotransferase family protein [Planctomycetia bacterium]|jgi:DNA-binding transcriptional MocR family regulator
MQTHTPLEVRPGENLYQAVADRVIWLIKNETLQPGDRVPSIRRMHKQLAVSIATVMQAYRLLEDRGMIEARPQSGYYVRHAIQGLPAEPTVARGAKSPRRVRVSSVSFALMDQLDHRGVIKLGAAVPDMDLMPLKTLNRILGQVLRKDLYGSHEYDTPSGCERLRIEIARRMLDAGVTVSPDDVVTTCGATEAMYLALLSTTNPGDTVAVETPTYHGILEQLEALKLKSLELRTDPREGIDIDRFEQAAAAGQINALVTVCNFSNPLGSCMPCEKKRQLVEIATKYKVPIIEDDIHGELFFEGTRPKALKAYDQDDWVIYCSSFTKTISPGCRTGWCIPGNRFAASFLKAKLVTTHAAPMPTQLAIASYLKQGGYDRTLRKARSSYRDRVRRMAQAVGEFFPEGTRVSNPSGGYVLWVEMPETIDSLKLYHMAIEHEISTAPGPLFSPIGHYTNCIRLNCGVSWSKQLIDALELLGRMAAKLA